MSHSQVGLVPIVRRIQCILAAIRRRAHQWRVTVCEASRSLLKKFKYIGLPSEVLETFFKVQVSDRGFIGLSKAGDLLLLPNDRAWIKVSEEPDRLGFTEVATRHSLDAQQSDLREKKEENLSDCSKGVQRDLTARKVSCLLRLDAEYRLNWDSNNCDWVFENYTS